QAEDGIRDFHVTGVQTCALPIYLGMGGSDLLSEGRGGSGNSASARQATMDLIRSRIKVKSMSFMRGRTFLNKFLIIDEAQNLTRSEERRVGKESRSGRRTGRHVK